MWTTELELDPTTTSEAFGFQSTDTTPSSCVPAAALALPPRPLTHPAPPSVEARKDPEGSIAISSLGDPPGPRSTSLISSVVASLHSCALQPPSEPSSSPPPLRVHNDASPAPNLTSQTEHPAPTGKPATTFLLEQS